MGGGGSGCRPWMRWYSGHPEFLGLAGPVSSRATALSPDGPGPAEPRTEQLFSIDADDPPEE